MQFIVLNVMAENYSCSGGKPTHFPEMTSRNYQYSKFPQKTHLVACYTALFPTFHTGLQDDELALIMMHFSTRSDEWLRKRGWAFLWNNCR